VTLLILFISLLALLSARELALSAYLSTNTSDQNRTE
jgi:Tfp pilus assembly protein PilX